MQRLFTILEGLPNGGKGTATDWVKEYLEEKGFVVTEFPMSSILREKRPDTTKWMDVGELVPDDIVIPVATDALQKAEGDIIILDGFPRRTTQILPFLKNVSENDDILILELNTPKEVAIQRAENRLACPCCGKTYTKVGKREPKVSGICDKCGIELIRRNDDKLIVKRIKTHEEYMIPAANLLKQIGVPSITIDYQSEESDIPKYLELLGL